MKSNVFLQLLKWIGAFGFIVAVILFGGCSSTELEERCFPIMTAVGFEDDKVSYMLGFPRTGTSGSEEPKINEIQVPQVFAKTFEESKSKYEGHLNKIADYNHLKIIVFEEDLLENKDAYKDVIAHMSYGEEFPRNTYVCAVEDIEDLMEIDKNLPQELGTYLEEFLTHHESKSDHLVTLGDLIDERENREQILYIPLLEAEDNYVEWKGYYTIDHGHMPTEDELLQASIASKILRFHVLANSDSEEDQKLKLEIRDAIGGYLQPLLKEAEDLNATKRIVDEHLGDVVKTAEQTIRENGYMYPVKACIKQIDFPDKTYGEYSFPAGEYEALQVTIGQGEGQNWWCVLYPNMCFKGAVYEVVEEEAKENLKEVLSPWEYEHVFNSDKVELRFKILEYFRD